MDYDFPAEPRRSSWLRTTLGGVILLGLLFGIALAAWYGGDQLGQDSSKAAVYLGLSFMLVAVGGGIAYTCWRIGRLLISLERELHASVDSVLPLAQKAGVSMDTVNVQLQKVDIIMDSAIDVASSVDTTVRSVSTAITEPIRAVSGVFAGMSGAMTGFRSRLDDDGDGDGDDEVRDDSDVPDSAQPDSPSDPVTGGGPAIYPFDIDDQLDAEADAYPHHSYSRDWDDV